MALVRWNPWSDLFDLHNQVDHLFQSLTTDTTHPSGDVVANLPVDIRQTDEAFVIEASVPGFRPEDVEVTLADGVLTVKGNRTSETEDKNGAYVRRERRRTSVYRQIGLPAEVRDEHISATFENGVLTITVPRAEKAQPKRIPVTSGSTTVIDAKS